MFVNSLACDIKKANEQELETVKSSVNKGAVIMRPAANKCQTVTSRGLPAGATPSVVTV